MTTIRQPVYTYAGNDAHPIGFVAFDPAQILGDLPERLAAVESYMQRIKAMEAAAMQPRQDAKPCPPAPNICFGCKHGAVFADSDLSHPACKNCVNGSHREADAAKPGEGGGVSINDLRELMAKATPGLWVDDPECAPCRVFSSYIRPGRTADIAPVVCETLPLCGDRRAQGPANAALIAAMHTMLPKLLAVCEAAKAVDEAEMAHERLRKALRELDNASKVPK